MANEVTDGGIRLAFPGQLRLWAPLLAGLAALLVPTAIYLWGHVWDQEAYSHGPIVLAIILWIVWRIPVPEPDRSAATDAIGIAALAVGLLMYVIGRSQSFPVIDVTAFLPILIGIILLFFGAGGLRVYWFPLLFVLFVIPVPGFILDLVTGPLKQHVSVLAENVLYAAGYPIGRSGVVLTIGQYQLLVADACSGLNSMFSLSAMGLLYLYLMQHNRWSRIIILVACILPIAFVANLIRVLILVLITYYLGDEAGQGFMHGMAGMSLYIISLLFLFAVDKGLGWVLPDWAEPEDEA